jgi:carboxypeptidase PM20D1
MRLRRRLPSLAGAALLGLAALLLIRTARLAPPALSPAAPPPPHAVPAAVVAEHLAAALRIDTVSHEDARLDDPGKLAALHALLAATYPRTHAAMPPERLGCGLLYTWKGANAALPPALFAAHLDVVPVEPGTEGAWTHPPFAGAIEGGEVIGRGALDDKGAAITLLEAAESLLAEGRRPQRTVMIALGCDEEVGGERGAKAIAAHLAARGVRLAYALDEGMAVTEGVVPDVDRPVAVIGLGEKGFVTVELSVEMPGGHSSMPPPETAVSVLARAVDRVATSPMPARLEGVPRAQLEAIAPFMPFGKRLAIANLWLLAPVVRRMMAKQPVTNAVVRTTTAPTVFEAGVKENVLPARGRALVNFRVLPGDTVAGVLAHVRTAIADDRVKVRAAGKLDAEPRPISSAATPAYARLEATVRRLYPDAAVVPGLVLGVTDGRHYAPIADAVYSFAPIVLRGAAARESIHGTNERVRAEDLATGVTFFREMIEDG